MSTDILARGLSSNASKKASLLKRRMPRRPATLTADAPTLSWSATPPVSGLRLLPRNPTNNNVGTGIRSNVATIFNSSFSWMDLSPAGFAVLDFKLTGTSVTIGWRSQTGTRERFWIWVDGQPYAITPTTPGVTTVTSSSYYLTLTWGTARPRRIEVGGIYIGQLQPVWVPLSGSVTPSPQRLKVHVVGDSFQTYTNMVTYDDPLPAMHIWLQYDVSVVNDGGPGSGYISGGQLNQPFGHPSRLAYITNTMPDIVVVMGTVNDDGNAQSSITSAAQSYFSAVKAINPNVLIAAVGPQPTNHTDTISATRQQNVWAVRDACLASNVPFYDILGYAQTTAAVPAFVNGGTYTTGQIVSYVGGLWKCPVGGTYNTSAFHPSGANSNWELLSLIWGTGSAGSPTGIGNRDVMLGSDGVHPTGQATPLYGEAMVDAIFLLG